MQHSKHGMVIVTRFFVVTAVLGYKRRVCTAVDGRLGDAWRVKQKKNAPLPQKLGRYRSRTDLKRKMPGSPQNAVVTKPIVYSASKVTYCRQHQRTTVLGTVFNAVKRIFTCQTAADRHEDGGDVETEKTLVTIVVEGKSSCPGINIHSDSVGKRRETWRSAAHFSFPFRILSISFPPAICCE